MSLEIDRAAWDAGIRGLTEQRQTLGEMRTLAGQVLGVGTAASGILGGIALDGSEPSWWALGAGIGWVAAAWFAAIILRPRKGWVFNLDSRTIAAWTQPQPDGSFVGPDDAYAHGADRLGCHHDSNNDLLNKLQRSLIAYLLGISISMAGWVAHIATR